MDSSSEEDDADQGAPPTLPVSCMAIFDGCMITGHADGRLMLADRDTMLSSVSRVQPHLALPRKPASPAKPVARVSTRDYSCADAFLAKHAAGSCPVLLTDATADWAARSRWSWEFFESDSAGCCGGAEVQVTHAGGKKRPVRLCEYVRALRGRGSTERQGADGLGYLRGWEFEKDVRLLSNFRAVISMLLPTLNCG